MPQHGAARKWLDGKLNGPAQVGLQGASLLAHLGGGPDLIPNAHVSALAIEHWLTLCSTDGDFARFRGLKWLNPLLRERVEKSWGTRL